MKFNYQARTKEGEIHMGQVEASSREGALTLLQKYDLYVTFLEKAVAPVYAKKIKIFERVSQKDIVLFSRQLAIMFKSKVPLIEALRVISSQTKNTEFKEKIFHLSEEVEGGTAFSKALAKYPQNFSPFYIAMVKSGEVSGKLSEVLTYLADHLEREYHFAAKTKSALVYPLLIVFVVVIVLVLMVFFVIPQLAEVLEASNEPLPTLTKFVIGSATFLRQWIWAIILGLSFIIFLAFQYFRTEKGKRFFDERILRLPIIGSLLKMVHLARFAENLSTLISGGLPIAQALEIVGDIIGNTIYKKVIFETRDEIRKGQNISSVLARYPEIFPPVFVQMVLVGEKTGTLDTTLMNIVDFYQKETDRAMNTILNLLEPALIVVLGLIVAGLMLSILMPLYQMVSL